MLNTNTSNPTNIEQAGDQAHRPERDRDIDRGSQGMSDAQESPWKMPQDDQVDRHHAGCPPPRASSATRSSRWLYHGVLSSRGIK